MNTAQKALADSTLRAYAVRVTQFSNVTVYDFADGSELFVFDSGRAALEYRA